MRRAVREALVDSPLPLALLRIVVPLVIVISPELLDARRLAASPDLLRFVPEGLGLVARLPLDQAAVRVLQIVAFSSAATAMLGYFSRASMLVLTLSAGLVFSLSQRQGAVVHDMHLFWMTALLAASPCGEAWSLDAWGKARPAASMRYGVPLMAARVLLGLVYFFPGLHKLRVSGLAWASSANVVGQMHAKWLEHGRVPSFRVDHLPLLCAIGGGLVVLFELSFLFIALSRRARPLLIPLGLLFHFSTQVFFFITFTSLWVCYAVLVDARWLERLRPAKANEERGPPLRASLVVGAVLVGFVLVQGARDATQAWPFACYPAFEQVQGPTIPDLVVEASAPSGETSWLTGRERAPRSQAGWGRVFRIAGGYGDGVDPALLRAHATMVIAGAELVPIAVYRAEAPTDPERWNESPATWRKVLLFRY